jgi:hypothetical protein
MHGVENRFLEATDDLDRSAHGVSADERSLILEEKLQEIADSLFDDPLLAFIAIKACAERQIRQLEALHPSNSARAFEDNPAENEPDLADPAAAFSVEGRPEDFFRRERETFEAIKGGLKGQAGRYVVIKGEEVAGVWPSYEAALDGGYERFGPVAFFVKQLPNAGSTDGSGRATPHSRPQ